MSSIGPILVFLANGTQGSAVVRAAERRGHRVRALVRAELTGEPSRARPFAIGDLDDAASLAAAAQGCTHSVLQVPTASQAIMVGQAARALDALRGAQIRSLVLKLASASRSETFAEPSFAANAAVEALVRGAGIPFSILRPTLYLDNLLKPSARADIAERGLFSPPIASGQRVAWTSTDDCAEAAILLLERGSHGGDYLIAGLESVDGEGLAARLSKALGKPIRYRAEPVERFESEVDAALGPGIGRQVASKFRYFRDHPDEADRILAGAYRPGSLPGFAPTSIEAWVSKRRELFG